MKGISKVTRAEQALEYLIEQLRAGRWKKGMPAERVLAEKMGISRPIVRLAIQKLEEDAFLVRQGGKRVPTERVWEVERKLRVLIVHSSAESSIPGSSVAVLQVMREFLSERGNEVVSTVCQELRLEDPEKALERLHNEYPYEVWVLRSPSREALEWCAEHHPRSVVLGSQPLPVLFSGVDLDADAMYRHSLEMCAFKQKKRAIFIVPPGESLAADRMRAFFSSFSVEGCRVRIEKLAMSNRREARRQMMMFLSEKPSPDAYVCTNFQQWLLVYSVLVEARVSPLRDVFLLCHYEDPMMQHISHGVGYYSFDWKRAGEHLAESALRVDDTKKRQVVTLAPVYQNPETSG